jgi:haloalkane dehalogenase
LAEVLSHTFSMNRPIRNSRIKLSFGRIFWREVGEGTVIVFLHGVWHDSSQWLSVMEYLSADYDCLAPDLLGFGESELPKLHYSIELQVECLAEYLKALKLRQVYLVGNSLGGWIAASYALKHLEEGIVRGLLLIAPLGVQASGVQNPWQVMRSTVNKPELWFRLLRLLRPITKLMGLQEKIEQAWKQRQKILASPTTYQMLFKRRQSEIDAELLQDKLPWLKIPVLILQGAQDTASAVAISQSYANLAPQAELKIINQGGSDLPQSLPGIVATHIRDFVKSY